jgi:hypothetical protein
VVVSVPLRHSWKPPLDPLFSDWLCASEDVDHDEAEAEERSNIEFFARELRPGWVCAGNEALKFQLSSHFRLCPSSVPFI